MHRTTTCLLVTFAFTVLIGPFTSGTLSAGENEMVQGTLWYQQKDNSRTDFKLIEGMVIPHELQGGERVKVFLVPEPIEREKFLKILAEEKGVLLFAAMEAGIKKYVVFDICRFENGSKVEVCGIHMVGPGLSLTESGFGVYNHFTESVNWENGVVSAKLKTGKPEQSSSTTYGFELSFHLPVTKLDIKS